MPTIQDANLLLLAPGAGHTLGQGFQPQACARTGNLALPEVQPLFFCLTPPDWARPQRPRADCQADGHCWRG